ncbi:unnamed protein product [Pedinophyceae sp. YPF-701]|nr:unnamed protein product [Pedinophyceae sp. YPF-701]
MADRGRKEELEAISEQLKTFCKELAKLVAATAPLDPNPERPELLLDADTAATTRLVHSKRVTRAAERAVQGVRALRLQTALSEPIDDENPVDAIQDKRAELKGELVDLSSELTGLEEQINAHVERAGELHAAGKLSVEQLADVYAAAAGATGAATAAELGAGMDGDDPMEADGDDEDGEDGEDGDGEAEGNLAWS